MQKLSEIFSDKTRNMSKNDWIILAIIVSIYAVISFINLGTFTNPQTFASFTEETEAVFEIEGNPSKISKIRYYTGENTGKYDLSISTDGINYKNNVKLENDFVFNWKDIDINQKAKYIKIELNSESEKGQIGEIALYDEQGRMLKLKTESNQDKLLIDEQDAVPEKISYMNSTYFDEIYFARTAYDYIHGISAYEWVHPPLGKLIQMIPIIFLGMTTFAYRLMGNIAGIIMVGAMYVFGKTMFKDSKYALLAGIVMAFDNFHFAQTRMGTVDSFLVLFIILSALFMFKYLLLTKDDSLKEKKKWLYLSGLFFGLSICTKWTGFYAGLGLCIMFFGKLILDIVRKEANKKDYTNIILSCIVYFVIIPGIIYVLSYFLFPNVMPQSEGVNSFKNLFKQTEEVYSYHSNLEAEHPFTSPWYTWPTMKRPVWLYVSYVEDGIKGTITGIGNPFIWLPRNNGSNLRTNKGNGN